MFKLSHEIESLHTDIATHARRVLIMPLRSGPSGRFTYEISPAGVHCQVSGLLFDGQVKTEFEIVSLVSPTAITVGPVCRDLL